MQATPEMPGPDAGRVSDRGCRDAPPVPWRVALLGGGVGRQHLAGWLALGGRATITAIVDQDPAIANELASMAGGARVFHDVDDFLRQADADIVDICLPPPLHAPVAEQALRAGLNVVCEKPMAGSLLEAERIASVAAAAGQLLVPVFQYRYGAGARILDKLQAQGIPGRPLAATLETHWSRGAEYYDRPWRGTWDGEFGGAVMIHAMHIHDLAGRILGPVTSVAAMLDTRVNRIETEDCAAICITTKSKALLTSSITLGSARNCSRMRMVFDRVTVESGTSPYAIGGDGWTFQARDPADQLRLDRAVEAAAMPDARDGFAGLFEDVIDRLEGSRNSPPSADDGISSLELATGIYHAARERRCVDLPLDRNLPICRHLRPTSL